MRLSIRGRTALGATAAILAGLTAAAGPPDRPVPEARGFDISHLSPEQRFVTLHDGTEPPFDNAYWDHTEEGIYVDAISGEALFSSTDKFDSGTGWPSFTRPINEGLISRLQDDSFGMSRIEVRSTSADAHLGHLFEDGPAETGGLRYCINSASLRFVARADMAAEGYGAYLPLFAGDP